MRDETQADGYNGVFIVVHDIRSHMLPVRSSDQHWQCGSSFCQHSWFCCWTCLPKGIIVPFIFFLLLSTRYYMRFWITNFSIKLIWKSGSEIIATLWIAEISSPFYHLREILKEIGYRDTSVNLAADVSIHIFDTLFILCSYNF